VVSVAPSTPTSAAPDPTRCRPSPSARPKRYTWVPVKVRDPENPANSRVKVTWVAARRPRSAHGPGMPSFFQIHWSPAGQCLGALRPSGSRSSRVSSAGGSSRSWHCPSSPQAERKRGPLDPQKKPDAAEFSHPLSIHPLLGLMGSHRHPVITVKKKTIKIPISAILGTSRVQEGV